MWSFSNWTSKQIFVTCLWVKQNVWDTGKDASDGDGGKDEGLFVELGRLMRHSQIVDN